MMAEGSLMNALKSFPTGKTTTTLLVGALAIGFFTTSTRCQALPFSARDIDVSLAKLTPLSIQPDEPKVTLADASLSGTEVVKKYSSDGLGSVCFVVRRPGWSLCREEGLQLSTAVKDNMLDGFEVFGVVKEVAVDDEGLEEFHRKYFNYPLYLDNEKEFYSALGGRKMGMMSLMGLIPKSFGSLGKRLKAKEIEGNFKGEGLLQGGIILFNKFGESVYSYQEITGEELPMKDIIEAADKIRAQSKGSSESTEL